jgi:hypothetical protein
MLRLLSVLLLGITLGWQVSASNAQPPLLPLQASGCGTVAHELVITANHVTSPLNAAETNFEVEATIFAGNKYRTLTIENADTGLVIVDEYLLKPGCNTLKFMSWVVDRPTEVVLNVSVSKFKLKAKQTKVIREYPVAVVLNRPDPSSCPPVIDAYYWSDQLLYSGTRMLSMNIEVGFAANGTQWVIFPPNSNVPLAIHEVQNQGYNPMHIITVDQLYPVGTESPRLPEITIGCVLPLTSKLIILGNLPINP